MKKNHRRLWAGVLVCLCLGITIRASAMQMGGFDINIETGENYYWQWQEEQQWNGNNQENTWENSSQEPEQPKDFQGNWQNNLPDHSGVSDQITENGYPNGTYDTSGGNREENGYSQWSSDVQWNSGDIQQNNETQQNNDHQWNNNYQWGTGYQWGKADSSGNLGNPFMNENVAGGQAENRQEESQQALSRTPERTQSPEAVNTPKSTTVPESSDVRKKTDSEAEKKNQGAKNEDKKNKDKRNKKQKNKEEKKKEKGDQKNQEKKNRNKENNQTKSKEKNSRNRTLNKTGEGDRTGKTDKSETKNSDNANSDRAGEQKNFAKYVHVKDESVEFQYQNGNEKSQTPRIRIISEGSVQILSLRVNGAECSWHWKGDWVVPDEESRAVKNEKGRKNNYSGNTLELLAVSQGGKLIKKTY